MEQPQSQTDQQSAVVACRTHRARVDAGAGTGKTSTLVRFALARPDLRGLYLAFNKSVREEAKRRFPATCRSSTFHALAYSTHGRPYHQAGKLVPSVRHASLLHLVEDRDVMRRFLRTRLAMQAVHEFVVSAAPELVPSGELCSEANRLAIEPGVLASDASRIWEAMVDLDNAAVGLSHDGYFKLWSLSAPAEVSWPVDYVVVDEAQDLNPVAHAILQRLTCDLLYVGDSAQSICAFRGAQDCLQSMPGQVLQLTKSFRFGPNIAALANALLRRFKSNPLTLTGMMPSDLVGPVQDDLPYAAICRTNAGVFSAAAAAVRRGQSIHFVGQPPVYGFTRIRQLYDLSRGRLSDVADPFLRALGSLDSVRQYAELVNDTELRSICRVVKQHGQDIPSLLQLFAQRSIQTPAQAAGPIEAVYPAQCFVGTCHQVKGLEFAQTRLADDFPVLSESDDGLDQQEVNLLYVALTRASFILEVPFWLHSAIGHPRQSLAAATVPGHAPSLPLQTVASKAVARGSLRDF